jgi:hypothetical protein
LFLGQRTGGGSGIIGEQAQSIVGERSGLGESGGTIHVGLLKSKDTVDLHRLGRWQGGG